MDWKIDQYVTAAQTNKSSRTILAGPKKLSTLTLVGNLALGNIAIGATVKSWLTFTNTGEVVLTGNTIALPEGCTYYGRVPAVLPVGSAFTILIEYTPTILGTVASNLVIGSSKKDFSFPFTATVTEGNLRYDGSIFYNNFKSYSGNF